MLADAKLQGKEAIAALKACLTQEHAKASQAKKIEKLRITTEHKAERAKVAAENKARQVKRRVCNYFLLFNIS